jgi:DNA (cytosine-5)-methyltransferase 1
MSNNRLTVIDTFSGCGGSSLGFKLAGFEELLAVECDPNAVQTFRLNFPKVNIFAGDINHLSADVCMQIAGVRVGELDIFSGSPPCQGYSQMGTQLLDDPRNQLFRQYVRLLQDIQPRVFTMENVKGMISGHLKGYFLEIIKSLRDCGYKVKAQVMNSKYFGVPQDRERIIFIGVREDLGVDPSHPKPFTKPITFAEAMADLQIPEDEPPYTPSAIDFERWHILQVGENKADKKYGWHRKAHVKLHPNQVVPTIVKTAASLPFHPTEPRRLLVCEAAALTGFPPDFKFIGSRSDRIARIGNCVPPPLMRAIAEHIKTNILG